MSEQAPSAPYIVVLLATRGREALLIGRSLTSVFAQTMRPDRIVVVNDGPTFGALTTAWLAAAVSEYGVRLDIVANRRARGAAGAWNTGIELLQDVAPDSWIAILDDDDTWDPDHLALNSANADGSDIVVSGLRLCVGGEIRERPLIASLEARDFLTGNPGWQGSNTFVRLSALLEVGGFRDGLESLNDRDFALRLLSVPRIRWRLVSAWTATWYADTPGNLSARGATAKLAGLRRFWEIYGAGMTTEEVSAYFDRSECLFGISRERIDDVRTKQGPSGPSPYGSLR